MGLAESLQEAVGQAANVADLATAAFAQALADYPGLELQWLALLHQSRPPSVGHTTPAPLSCCSANSGDSVMPPVQPHDQLPGNLLELSQAARAGPAASDLSPKQQSCKTLSCCWPPCTPLLCHCCSTVPGLAAATYHQAVSDYMLPHLLPCLCVLPASPPCEALHSSPAVDWPQSAMLLTPSCAAFLLVTRCHEGQLCACYRIC